LQVRQAPGKYTITFETPAGNCQVTCFSRQTALLHCLPTAHVEAASQQLCPSFFKVTVITTTMPDLLALFGYGQAQSEKGLHKQSLPANVA
jgi:hypothetical protein